MPTLWNGDRPNQRFWDIVIFDEQWLFFDNTCILSNYKEDWFCNFIPFSFNDDICYSSETYKTRDKQILEIWWNYFSGKKITQLWQLIKLHKDYHTLC
jgi:hypothetical protein